MNYRPRHPVLNLISAAAMVMFGVIFLVSGLSDIKNPKFAWDAWGIHTNVMYGVVFVALWIAVGGIGVYYFSKYLRHERTQRKIKTDRSPRDGKSG